MKEKWLSILLSGLTAVLVLAGSISVPLLCRPFYYAHIDALSLCDTGLTEAEIRQAYDEMMDFCLGQRDEFSVGRLIWSESGKAHFEDVRELFLLDLSVLGIAAVLLLGLAFLCRKQGIHPACFKGHGAGFWGAVGLGVVFLVVGGLVALDFEQAFLLFHQLFFPGKSNWIFDWRTDPIILLLPEVFFRNCALLIFALILVWCGVLIGADCWAQKRNRTNQQETDSSLCAGCSGCS